ncbi:MAG: protein arginine kinase [candidate division WOR-3 bacterium]|nr:protein arginine kinase [candidate division WOR-3 bacterium]
MKNEVFDAIDRAIPSWLDDQDARSAIVLSSRVRFARNLAGYHFVNRLTPKESTEILDMVTMAITKEPFLQEVFPKSGFITLNKITPLKAEFLMERHLISPDFIQQITKLEPSKTTNGTGRGVFISPDETTTLMVNEEDHIRLQVLTSGFDFKTGFAKLNEIDDHIESVLHYAFSSRYGFLTACPSNVGTGLRASVLIHLPGLVLTKEIEKTLRSIWQINYAVRGLFGEGTETRGYFFQISNTITLGQSEQEIIEGIEKVTEQLVAYEQKAREYLLKHTKIELEDKIYRAYAILKSARIITSEETLNLLATVRLGVALNLIKDISFATLNKIMLLLRPANLQIFYNQEMSPAERDEKRAILIKQLLNQTQDQSN